jgi:NAD(P)-dependent dehydrogenase (short-subunit alcohol dehydrogenase family)
MVQSWNQPRFEGKVVIVTGAAHGIGQGVAAGFAREGAVVYGMDLDREGLQASGQALLAAGGRFTGIVADVSKPADISRSVQRIEAEAGRIDVLVNNAGINMGKRIAELELADWERVFDTNLRSVYLMCKAAWPALQACGSASIVNMASVMGQVGGVGAPAYCSTKAAIIMLSRCLAKDGAASGIRVNSVCPGYIDTPIMDRVLDAMPDPVNARAQLIERMPLRRLGSPGDIAAGVLFLASSDAAYISGIELTIDGAVTATQIDS